MITQLWTHLRGEEQTILFPVPARRRVSWVDVDDLRHGTESRYPESILRFMEAPDFTPECVGVERLTEWETETTTTI